MIAARALRLSGKKQSGPGMPGPSYPNGAAAYQHAGIIPRLGAHTPRYLFEVKVARPTGVFFYATDQNDQE
jgi:hypothetical protein